MKRLNQKKALSAAVSMAITLTVCSSVSVRASDIEIYSAGFTPNPVVMFALDNSGSMSGTTQRRAFDMKDSMQAVLLGEGSILPARNVLAGLSSFESVRWYPVYSGNQQSSTVLYYTAVHPIAEQVDAKKTIKRPRYGAGHIISPVQELDGGIVYPSTRKDIIPSNGDVIFKNGSSQPEKTGNTVTINDANKKVYVRIQADIPRGATINAAYLELRSTTNNNAKKLKIRLAKHNDLYAANPSITNLQTFPVGVAGTDARSIVSGVNNNYLNKILSDATSQRSVEVSNNKYQGENLGTQISGTSGDENKIMYINSMDVRNELQELITNNTNWCGMGDLVFEIAKDSDNYTFFANREDRVNPQLYVDWTLTNNTQRNNNCIFADTKRSSAQRVTNLGNVGVVGSMTGRQSLSLEVQRIITNTQTPYSAIFAETFAYLLGNGTKPYSSSTSNTSIDIAAGLTTGNGNNIKYLSPIQKVREYLADSTNVSKENAYKKEQQCGQHGVYFLTDGEETPAPATNDNLFSSSLLGGSGTFICNGYGRSDSNGCSARMAGSGALSTGYQTNNRQLKIKTSVVGFDISNSGYIYAVNKIAEAGQGSYSAVSSGAGANAKQGIVNSVNAFLDDVFNLDIPETVTGSPTLPQDALNPLRIQPYGYYASFTPKLNYQLWSGNLNKYNVVNGALVGANGSSIFKADGSLDTNIVGLWAKNLVNGYIGMKGALDLGVSSEAKISRNILTNRNSDGTASEQNSLTAVTFDSKYITTDTKQKYWLNLLGYNVDTSVQGTLNQNELNGYKGKTADLRQVGAVMHSTPILLTQAGTIKSDLETTGRQDYLLFGSTQGLLHMVNSTTGKEVFAFVPNEMMEGQPDAFIDENKSGGSNLFYGIDAPWAAYTEYVSNIDGSLTVGQSNYKSSDKDKTIGKQWVYGGLRMGGRSYYALDLSHVGDANSAVTDKQPKLKFHINPKVQSIYYGAYKDAEGNDVAAGKYENISALNSMGQSWSKPTLAYVKFGGEKKLVMFVGGGYDAGYENPAYNPTGTTQGAGVYMFDANNGKLLWWTGANATAKQGAEAYTSNTDMKYSVVSQINAIDRDNDGLVDNLYFGDLGGQAFRVDLNNDVKGVGATATVQIEDQKTKFATHVVRLFTQNAGASSPRFYEMPSFSVHRDSALGLYGVVALSSGNRSSPLSGVEKTYNNSEANQGRNNNQSGATLSADDGVFVIFDKDIGKSSLYAITDTDLTTKSVSLEDLALSYKDGVMPYYKEEGNAVAVTKAGWYYRYGNGAGAGVYKGMNSIYAVDSILYANVFDRDGKGSGNENSCGAGVKGDSYLYRFCLPSGVCPVAYGSPMNTNGSPDRTKLGAGILASALGSSSNNLLQNTVANNACFDSDGKIIEANKNKLECQQFTTAGKIRTLRWYEMR